MLPLKFLELYLIFRCSSVDQQKPLFVRYVLSFLLPLHQGTVHLLLRQLGLSLLVPHLQTALVLSQTRC